MDQSPVSVIGETGPLVQENGLSSSTSTQPIPPENDQISQERTRSIPAHIPESQAPLEEAHNRQQAEMQRLRDQPKNELVARQILGEFVDAPTVALLMPQAYQMRSAEWQVIKRILQEDERARIDLQHLSQMLDIRKAQESQGAPQVYCVFSFAGCQHRFLSKNEWRAHVWSQHLSHVAEYKLAEVAKTMEEFVADDHAKAVIRLKALTANEQAMHPFVKWASKERIVEREFDSEFRLSKTNEDHDLQYNVEKKVASQSDDPVGAFSDSGYASMGRDPEGKTVDADDDDHSVCTDGQELHIEEEAKAKLVSTFSSETIKHLYLTLARMDRKRSIAKPLADLLKEFSIRLQYDAKPGPQKDTSVFVRHCRQ